VVVNTLLMSVVKVDIQEEDTVPEVMLLVAEVVDSSVCSLLILLKEVKSSFVLVLVVAVATNQEVTVVANPVEKPVETAELVLLNKDQALEHQVLMELNSKEETVTLVVNRIVITTTDQEEVLVTSVEKVVVTMPAVAVVAQDFVTTIS
jgi:hypothetical protein